VNSETRFLKKLSDNNVVFRQLMQQNHIEEVLVNLPNSNRVALLPSFIFGMLDLGFTSRHIGGFEETIPFALISLAEANSPIIASLKLSVREQ
jgi:hypothetical protein